MDPEERLAMKGHIITCRDGDGIRISFRKKEQWNGAGDEIRTHDFNLGKVALYP